MEELMKGMMGGDSLRPDELEMIEEHVRQGEDDETSDLETEDEQPGLGEDLQRAHDLILTGPRAEDMDAMISRKKLVRPKMKPITRRPGTPAQEGIVPSKLPTQRVIGVVPNDAVISNFQVTNAGPSRVDLGIEYRTDILIANMSASIIWVNTIPNVHTVLPLPLGAYLGVPLRPNTALNSFDGGVMRLSVTNRKRFWAQAVTAVGSFLIVTIEQSLRE